MSASNTCPECGIRVPIDAPHGLCPRCLMNASLSATALELAEEKKTRSGLNRSPVVTWTEMLDAIRELDIVPAAELDRIASGSGEDPAQLARALGLEKKLTAYQAGALLQGKARGLVIGQYLVLDKLGIGGMGVVFKARHRPSGHVVALKILPPTFGRDPETVRRFHREFQIASRLSHPNLVAAIEANEDRGVHYLTMDYIPGYDLDRLVSQGGPMALKLALHAAIQVARGLEAAHAQGIIHRDIKPGNIMIDPAGGVRVLDLGLARVIEAANQFGRSAAGSLTQSGMYMGTVDFLAPEQANDAKSADGRSDIYSLGCTLYFLLTAKPPFQGGTILKLMIAHQDRPAPSLRAARPEVPEALEEIYLRMMAKHPEDRPQTMSEVIMSLEACRTSAREAGDASTDLKTFARTVLKRAPARGTRGPDASIYARPSSETGGLSFDPNLTLEDLVGDYRPELGHDEIPEHKLPPIYARPKTHQRRRHRIPVPFVMFGGSLIVLALAWFVLNPGSKPDSAEAEQPAKVAAAPEPEVFTVKSLPVAAKPKAAAPDFRPLFNGKDLTGWVVERGDPGVWSIDRGEIVARGQNDFRKLSFLLTDRDYSDFIARFEFQAPKNVNSGFVFRATPGDNDFPIELNILTSPATPSRAIALFWSKSGRDEDSIASSPPAELRPEGTWNEMEAECRGDTLRAWLNGREVLRVDLRDLASRPGAMSGLNRRSGRIGFQAHSGTIRFRNIEINDLTASSVAATPSFRQLFNGSDSAEWEGRSEYWRQGNGMLVGSPPPGRPDHTFYCSRREYRNFELRFSVRLKGGVGNSGVQFRSTLTDHNKFRVVGPQCELGKLSADYAAGSVVSEPMGTPSVRANRQEVAKAYKEDQFNDFSIRCVGKHVIIRLNGVTTVDAEFPSMPDAGIIAWQLHGSASPVEVTFKDVTLAELD